MARSVERACENKGVVSNTQVVPYCARLHVALAILAPMSQRVYALTGVEVGFSNGTGPFCATYPDRWGGSMPTMTLVNL